MTCSIPGVLTGNVDDLLHKPALRSGIGLGRICVLACEVLELFRRKEDPAFDRA